MPDEREHKGQQDPVDGRPWPEMGQRERWQFFKRVVDRMQPLSPMDQQGSLGRRPRNPAH